MLVPRTMCAAVLGLAAGLLGWQAAHAETLNWITYKPKGAGDPQAVTTQWFADEIEKRSGGKHKVRIHWGGSVANINEIPNAIENGAGDMGDVVTPYFPEQLLINNAISYFIPQPHNSLALGKLMEEWHAKHAQFAAELAKYKQKLIALRPLEEYGMICTKPVKTVADFKGLRVRSFGFALPAVIKALGGVPVSMGTPETYEGLSRGIIDCSPVGPTLAAGWKYDEVAKFYVELPLGATWGHLVTVNLDKFNKLPKDLQDVLVQVGQEYLVQYTTEMDKQEQAIRKRWTDSKKVEIVPFPKADFVSVVSKDPAIKAVQDEWVKKASGTGLDTAAIVKSLSFH